MTQFGVRDAPSASVHEEKLTRKGGIWPLTDHRRAAVPSCCHNHFKWLSSNAALYEMCKDKSLEHEKVAMLI